MAVTIAAQAELSRLGTFFDPTQDWTWFLQVKNGSTTPATVFFRQYLTYGDPSSAHSYIALRSPAASNNIVLKTFDGSTTSTSTAFTPVASTWAWIGVTYSAATHTLTFYANSATPVGTLSVNLSTFVFTETTSAVGSTVAGTSFGDFGANYIRQWQVALTGADLVLEAASKTPIQMGTLLTNTPVQASIDLTAHNNTLTQWSATGTVTTDTADALLTVTAAPPTNTTPATAITLTFDDVCFQDMVSGGSAIAAGWYKVTVDSDGCVGAMAFGDLATYKPSITPYEGLANANAGTAYFNVSSDLNAAIQIPVSSGNDYYFKVARNAAVSPAVAQISLLRALDLPVPIGSIMVNDDSFGDADHGGFVCAMDVNTGYPMRFIRTALGATGEGGCPLANGQIILCQDVNGFPVLYDFNLALVRELSDIGLTSFDAVSSNLTTTFAIGTYPGSGTGHGYVRLCSADGVLNPTVFDTGLGNSNALGLNVDASKFYYTNGSSSGAVKAWVIATNIAGSDLTAAVANTSFPKGPIVVLSNGTILIPRVINATHHFTVDQVDASGTLLQTYDFGEVDHGSTNDSRLATDIHDPTFFWIWGKEESPLNGFSFFQKVTTSTGVLAVNLTHIVEYESGLYFGDDSGTNVTPVRFGPSESCPFWINRTQNSPIPSRTYPTRRLRRFLLPSSESNYRMFMSKLELLMETGVGLLPDAWGSTANSPQGANPQIMVRFSTDGGKTWHPEQWRSAGMRGQYEVRPRWLKPVRAYRNAVCEVVVSDPVAFRLISALGEFSEGSS